MNNTDKLVPYSSPLEALLVMHQLTKIALRVHAPNLDLVDMKMLIAKLSPEVLMQIDEDLTRIIKENS